MIVIIPWMSIQIMKKIGAAWKLSKYDVVSVYYFPVFGLNTGKYRPEITPYLNTFHTVSKTEGNVFRTVLTGQKYLKTRISVLTILLHKKWIFPLRISSVNVTKSEVSYGFGHIYRRNPQWRTSFFVKYILKIRKGLFKFFYCSV